MRCDEEDTGVLPLIQHYRRTSMTAAVLRVSAIDSPGSSGASRASNGNALMLVATAAAAVTAAAVVRETVDRGISTWLGGGRGSGSG